VNRLLGVHQDAKPAAVAARVPGAAWGREFVAKAGGGPLPESTSEKALVTAALRKVQPHLDAGGGCVVSIKADMVSVGKGRWDSRLAAVGAAVEGKPVEVVLWHEPEDNLQPSVFVAGHNRGRDAVKSGGPSVPVDYCGMAYQWRPGSKTTADPKAWAADLAADRLLLDVYFGKTFPATLTLANHPGLQRWLEHMVLPYDGTWGLGEFGRQNNPGRAAQFAADFQWLAGDPVGSTCSMVIVWGTGGTEADPGWLLDEPALEAVAAGFARLAGPPAGYRPSGLDGFLVCERDGCAVAGDLVAEHDQLHA